MSVFIDTGVFVAARNARDINHKRAVELLEKAIRGEYGGYSHQITCSARP